MAVAIEAAHAKGIVDLNPNHWFDYLFLGRAYEQKGQWPEAIAAFQRGLALEDNTELWAGLGHVYGASGNAAEARKVLAHLEEMSATRYVAPLHADPRYRDLLRRVGLPAPG